MRHCENCGYEKIENQSTCPNCGTALDVPRRSPWRRAGTAIFLGLVVIALIVGGVMFVSWFTVADDAGVEQINVGDRVVGTIGPETPIGMADKPYVDYELGVAELGEYQIEVTTTDPSSFDPYLSVTRDMDIVTVDDNGGEGVNARVVHQLRPGTYTVRVTRHEVGELEQPVGYVLTIQSATDLVATR